MINRKFFYSQKLLSTEGGSNKTTTTTTSTTTAAATTITPTVRTETASKKRALSTDSSGENGNGNGAHKKKPERGIYQPPSGKYSTSVVEGNNGAGFTANKRRTASSGAGITFNRGRRFQTTFFKAIQISFSLLFYLIYLDGLSVLVIGLMSIKFVMSL